MTKLGEIHKIELKEVPIVLPPGAEKPEPWEWFRQIHCWQLECACGWKSGLLLNLDGIKTRLMRIEHLLENLPL